jgi:hypothetical protein
VVGPAAAPAAFSPPPARPTASDEVRGAAQLEAQRPSQKRPRREGATRVNSENVEVFDSLGATIESVLATRWYGSDRPSSYSGRVLRADEIAPVTPSGLIADLATAQQQETPPPPPPSRRNDRIVAALCLVAIFAAALFASLLWRSGHGFHLPTRIMPALFGAVSIPLPERSIAAAQVAVRETKAPVFLVM